MRIIVDFRIGKKIAVLVFIFFISSHSYGQHFTVTSNGLRDSDNVEKSFIVIDVEKKSAEQLFNNAKKFIVQTYKNPDFVQKGIIENEYIRFNSYTPYIATINAGLTKLKYDAKYAIELYFKDGRVRYEIIDLEIKTDGVSLNFTPKGALSGWYIYNKKGKLKQEVAKQEIESYFNNQIEHLLPYLKGVTKMNEDW